MALYHHKTIRVAENKKVYFCGDTHGHLTELKKQLDEISFDYGNDTLVLTGDFIDRGPESAEMIDFVTCTPGVHSVLGNHELMFLEAVYDDQIRSEYTSSRYGGDWIESYSPNELENMADLIRGCVPVAITVEKSGKKLGVIHAASPVNWTSNMTFDTEDLNYYLWSRDQFQLAVSGNTGPRIEGVNAVIHGHVCSELVTNEQQVWIDTFATTGKFAIVGSLIF